MATGLPFSTLDKILECLQSLSGVEFQDMLVEHLKFRSDEFSSVSPGPRKGQDSGVDITARFRSPTGAMETIVFSCKRWDSGLGATEVDGLSSAATRNGAQQGVLVSTASLSAEGRKRVAELQVKTSILYPYEPWTERGLAETLAMRSPHLLLEKFPELSKLLALTSIATHAPSFEIIDTSTVAEAGSADWFYDGFPPTWEHLKADFDLPRSVYSGRNGVREAITSMLSGEAKLSILAIMGASGSGKTTLLRRAAFDARLQGIQVIRLKDNWAQFGVPIYSQIQSVVQNNRAPTIVLLDDAADIFSSSPLTVDAIETILSTAHFPIVMLVAEEPHHWNRIQNQPLVKHPKYSYLKKQITHLNDDECGRLVDKIISLENGGQLTQKGLRVIEWVNFMFFRASGAWT